MLWYLNCDVKSTYSVVSRMQNCVNPTKYIYWLHKWLAYPSVHRKWEWATFVNNWCILYSFSFFCQRCNQAFSMWLFMIGQLLIAQLPKEELPSFIVGVNGHRADDMKWTLLDFSSQFIKESSCSRRIREWGRGDDSGRGWLGGWGCFVGCFGVGSASLKKFQTTWMAKCCLTLQASSFFI